jgi:uncharacterized protein YjbJ (UPF0337 family)
MSHDEADTAAQARQGLFDHVAGKAKEVAGAVTGKDDLVEEGQIQQAGAQNRKAAVAEEAVADAKREEAARELHDTTQDAAEAKQAADDRADVAQRGVERERSQEHAAAEQAAAQQEAVESRAAEQRAEDVAAQKVREAEALATEAASTEQQATQDRARLDREAAAAEHRAAQLRDQNRSQA